MINKPLTRRGRGPGLVLIVDASLPLGPSDKTDPPPLVKWAEEGYCVAQVMDNVEAAIQLLKDMEECTGEVGLIAYTAVDYKVNVDYSDRALSILPSSPTYSPSVASLSHTRALSILKPLIGPHFDLEAIWTEHTHNEFTARDVPATMATMVASPYVNHIPTLTGGIGADELSSFYATRFIPVNPPDVSIQVVSRSISIDRLIDEFVFSGTHSCMIDWMLPGVPPTGQRFEVAMTCIVNFRGDRLYHEHISWDQASLLRQLGLLPEYLPFPYAEGYEYRVPVAGVETARKLVDEGAVESNGMFEFRMRNALE